MPSIYVHPKITRGASLTSFFDVELAVQERGVSDSSRHVSGGAVCISILSTVEQVKSFDDDVPFSFPLTDCILHIAIPFSNFNFNIVHVKWGTALKMEYQTGFPFPV